MDIPRAAIGNGTNMFPLDQTLLEKARNILTGHARFAWLIGGSGSGKSTLTRALSEQIGIPLYDMDEAVFGRFQFDPTRHPATTAWFTAANPLHWMLSQPWPAFDALYRAANAEYLDLLADDLAGRPDAPLLIDGGITHPSVLTQAVPAARIICLERDEAQRAGEWDTAPGRAAMRAEVLALPDGEALWRRFLDYDRRLTDTIGRESRACGIRVVAWDEGDSPEQVGQRVLELFD
jgi:energy-coupling factor transporter ATP-binding protein EcfA2